MKKSMALLLTLALLISTIPTALAAQDGDIVEHLLTIGDMPLYEVYRDDGAKKPIVILLHGGGGRKEDNLSKARGMAEQGFYALTVDAAACGENKVHTLDVVVSWATTVEQLDAVLDHYAAVPQADTEHFGMTGASMGGTVCYAYAAHGKYTPTIITPSVGTPDYATMSDDILYGCYSNVGDYTSSMSRKEIKAFAEEYAPVNFPERFLDVYIYAQNGTEDPTASPEGIRKLEQALKDLGGTRFIFNIYEGVGHEGSPDYNDVPALRQILLGDTSHPVFSDAAAVSQAGLQNFTQRNQYIHGRAVYGCGDDRLVL